MSDPKKNSYYEDRIREMSGGSIDLSSYVTLSFLQTGYTDTTTTQNNLNTAISNLSSVYLSQANASTNYLSQANASTNYLTKTAATLLYAPIGSGSGSGNPNISFGSVNLSNFATSKSIS